MSDHKDNAVGRLYLLLQFVLSRHDTTGNIVVLADYLGIEARPDPELYSALSAVLALPNEARTSFTQAGIKSVPRQATLEHIDAAQTAVVAMMILNNACADVKRYFGAGTLVGLEYASYALSTFPVEQPIDKTNLDKIRAAANDLIDALAADETLSSSVKRVLLDHAEGVLHALNLVTISGTEAVVQERDRLQGHLRRQPTTFIDAFRNSRVGVALVALNLALVAVGNATTQGLAIEKGVDRVYELLTPERSLPAIEPKRQPDAAAPTDEPSSNPPELDH